MKKVYLLIGFAVLALVVKAQQPSITLTVQVDGNDRNLVFCVSDAGTKLQIDWGDGVLVETEEIAVYDGWENTTVTGVPKNDGVIKVYGENVSYFEASSRVDGAQLTSVDVTNAPELVELSVYTNSLTTLDVSHNLKLQKLNCYNNPLTELDLSSNVSLTRLDARNMSLGSIDLSHNVALTYLALNGNPLTSIDLSSNVALTSLYLLDCGLSSIDLSSNAALTYVSLNNNNLTSLDVSGCPKLGTLFCTGNKLTELKADNVLKNVNCSNNCFTLSTLPALGVATYNYAPQVALSIPERLSVGECLDLSSQTNLQGLSDSPQPTTYVWKTGEGTELVPGEDYTEENGVFTFLKTQPVPVYCEMTTGAFPKFTGVNAFKTTELLVEKGTSIAETDAIDIRILNAGGIVKVMGLAGGDDVTVYNVSGTKVAQVCASGTIVELPLSAGIYVVSVNGKAHKVIVR